MHVDQLDSIGSVWWSLVTVLHSPGQVYYRPEPGPERPLEAATSLSRLRRARDGFTFWYRVGSIFVLAPRVSAALQSVVTAHK